jgi:ribonuclease E
MSKKMLIDATHAEETRVVVVDGNRVEEFDFETINKRQLAGNIYLAKVTRVEPSLQAAFVDYGGNRHGFLAFAEIHPDYYQIPLADRIALLEEERAFARAEEEEENRPRAKSNPRGNGRRRNDRAPRPESSDSMAEAATGDAVQTGPSGMEVVELDDPALEQIDEPSAPEAAVETASEGTAPLDHDPADHDHVGHGKDDHAAHDHDETASAHDHSFDPEDEIESIAEEDVAEEISAPRRPRARRYKIQEVIKVRQIMLIQVVKEERGNKGAALTTYLSLAGRYCVLMPNTARGGGISRKIVQAADRKKLKEIANEIKVPEGAGLIIRTAGAKRTKPEITRDYEYLMRLWEQIRELTLKSMAPAAIYEEGNLIKRSIRDLYSREIEEILVEGEAGYRTAKDFMRMIMPSHAKQVIRYDDPTPLFARYQVESYLGGMFNPTVQLKSGGYIVIGITEALVAVDVNSGRATKEGSIEDTALKTNLEAAEEVARQLRLRDLAGLIVIDFIDMDERRNNLAVEKRLKDKLKTDRARIQVGRISGFGLMEMSRQRLRPGMLESTTQPCAHCHGTGLIRSDDSLGLQVLRALEEEGTRKRSKEVVLRAPIGIVNFLINQKREHIALIEARSGMSVRIECDPAMISPDFTIEKLKVATRVVPDNLSVISGNASLMGAPVAEEDYEDDVIDEAVEDEEVTEVAAETRAAPAADAGKKRRRRRRRKKPGQTDAMDASDEQDDSGAEEAPEDVLEVAVPEPTPKRSRAPRGGRAKAAVTEAIQTDAPAAEPVAQMDAEPQPVVEAVAAPKRGRKPKVAVESVVQPAPSSQTAPEETAAPMVAAPVAAAPEPQANLPADIGPADTGPSVSAPVETQIEAPSPKPRKKGWWNLGG